MTIRVITATAVAAVIAAAAAGSASTASAAVTNCGTVKAAGATWAVFDIGVPCSAGKPLIRKLAAKPHSLYTILGKYLGLKCV